jgi:fructose-bisphosphate aldolase class II
MVSYKELGLVNTKEMFAKAIEGGYAIPAFNFNNMEQMQAIIKAAVETNLQLFFKYLKVLVNMLMLLFYVIWLKVRLSMQKS